MEKRIGQSKALSSMDDVDHFRIVDLLLYHWNESENLSNISGIIRSFHLIKKWQTD